ncbi:MAG: MBOAT family O-acyltransferase [Sedimentisphaerales bacterium]|nr:MBOAT family O-acyltransferase [Sedimentisphaerales bacterium]
MLFNTWTFAIFLPAVLLIYYNLNRRWQNCFLLAASYVFYGWWDYRFCSLLAISTIVDFFCGLGIASAKTALRRKLLLAMSCVVNLGILSFFKYFDFFTHSFSHLFEIAGFRPDFPTLSIILPVGISFYTFQTLSYSIDVYRSKIEPTRNFIDFALYVSFFPQLVAGPIERATRLLPQIQAKRTVTWDKMSGGAMLILIGLCRKIAIADAVAPTVNRIFADPSSCGSLELLIGTFIFSLQIYCDFAGYSDIARGTAKMLGIDLIKNFEHPYFSTNITEFWRRWHISFSTWLRDYLYIPLGGNRRGRLATYRNLLITMLLGGLWHGANWTFVVWGGLQGLYLAIHKLLLQGRKPDTWNRPMQIVRSPADILKLLLTFLLVSLTWIFFRCQNFGDIYSYFAGIIAFQGGIPTQVLKWFAVASVLVLAIDIPQYITQNHTVVLEWPVVLRVASYTTVVLAMFALRNNGRIPFIYFQF